VGPTLKRHFEGELARARTLAASDPARAWKALERAHILSQAYVRAHVRVHARMLVNAWRERRWREVLGQLPRIVLAVPGSWLGRAPLGNTGGSDVGIFTPMPIPDDLQKILDEELR
jgi:hypothetical protein